MFKTTKLITALMFASLTSSTALVSTSLAATLHSENFGTTSTGKTVKLYTMKAANGLSVSFMSFGGTITKIMVPDRNGKLENVVLGFPTLKDYEQISAKKGLFFGALIGRYANRIADGHFSLDGHQYSLPINDTPNSLHGGNDGFFNRVWSVQPIKTSGNKVSAELHLVSPDGDQGYPGKLDVTVTYSLSDNGAFSIDYRAKTDKPTVLNLTNHSYFNLAGVGSQYGILNQMMLVNADQYTPVSDTLIPTGELASVEGTPFDFRVAKPIGRDIRTPNQQLLRSHGYDHNWVLSGKRDKNGLIKVATIWDPVNGRMMTCSTTEPGVQIYTSNFLNATYAGSTAIYRQSDAVTFETQHFPDSPNHPNFPSTRLDPGKVFQSHTVFHFSTHTLNH